MLSRWRGTRTTLQKTYHITKMESKWILLWSLKGINLNVDLFSVLKKYNKRQKQLCRETDEKTEKFYQYLPFLVNLHLILMPISQIKTHLDWAKVKALSLTDWFFWSSTCCSYWATTKTSENFCFRVRSVYVTSCWCEWTLAYDYPFNPVYQ